MWINLSQRIVSFPNQKVVEIALKVLQTMDFLHTQITFCLVMMMRIFREWLSTSCVAFDQKHQAIQLNDNF